MKKLKNRVIALLCAFVMVISGIVITNEQQANAATNEWYIVNEKIKLGSSNSYEWLKDDLGINLGKTDEEIDDLMLYLRLDISESVYKELQEKAVLFKLEVANQKEGHDKCEYEWDVYFDDISLKIGRNEILVPWTAAKLNQSGGTPSIASVLNYFRLYTHDATGTANYPLQGLVIDEVKIVDVNGVQSWSIVNQATTITGQQNHTWVKNEGFSVELNKTDEEISDIMLYVTLNLTGDVYRRLTSASCEASQFIVEVAQTVNDYNEYEWKVPFNKIPVKEGKVVMALPWTEAAQKSKDGGASTVETALKYFRLYATDSDSKSKYDIIPDIEIEEVKVVDISEIRPKKTKEWVIVSEPTTVETTQTWAKSDCNINIDKQDEDIDELALYVKLNLTDEVYNAITTQAKQFKLELAKTKNDKYEYEWDVMFEDTSLEKGENVFVLPLVEANQTSGDKGVPTIEQSLNYFRIFCRNGEAAPECIKGLVIEEVKLVDTTPYVGMFVSGAEGEQNPATLGLDTSGVPEGYTFAGWYTDKACTDILKGASYGRAYGKFVREDVLDVKAQCADNGNGTAAIRFITTVDTCKYKEVGFDITINNKTLSKSSKVVYKNLYAVGANSGNTITYKPTDIDATSQYFNTYTIDGIPTGDWDEPITVQSYWITQDGTKVLGTVKTYKIEEMAKRQTEWYILSEAITLNNTDHNAVYAKTDCNVNIGKTDEEISDLMLYVRLDVSDSVYTAFKQQVDHLLIEVAKKKNDKYEYEWTVTLADMNLKKGVNILALPWANATQTSGDNGVPTVEETLNYFRLVARNSNNNAVTNVLQGLEIEEVKIVDVTSVPSTSVIASPVTLNNTENTSGKITYVKSDCNVNLNKSDENISDLVLYVTLDVPETVYTGLKMQAGSITLEMAQEKQDYSEYEWNVSIDGINLKQGENILAIPWVYATSKSKDEVMPTVEETLKFFRLFALNKAGDTAVENVLPGLVIKDVRVLDMAN